MSDAHKATVVAIERREPTAGMSPVVSAGLAILERNPSPETLRELLAVQRDWEANEARKAYAAALVALKRDMPTVIARDKEVSFNKTHYTHASLGAVMDAVTGPLTQHGFSLTWHPATSEGKVSVTCRLAHAAGHHEQTTISAPIDNSGSKSAAQGVMSTITLLSRYTALSLLGIATADMEDPHGEESVRSGDPDSVDSQRNLRAVGWLTKRGIAREEAEFFIGRKVPDWTADDLAKLKTWGSKEPGSEG